MNLTLGYSWLTKKQARWVAAPRPLVPVFSGHEEDSLEYLDWQHSSESMESLDSLPPFESPVGKKSASFSLSNVKKEQAQQFSPLMGEISNSMESLESLSPYESPVERQFASFPPPYVKKQQRMQKISPLTGDCFKSAESSLILSPIESPVEKPSSAGVGGGTKSVFKSVKPVILSKQLFGSAFPRTSDIVQQQMQVSLFKDWQEEETCVVGVADTDETAGLVSHPPEALGSIWIRHSKHGLLRRSARIAARNRGNPE
jgi:hypothetical protein